MVPKPLQKLDGDSPLMSIVARGGDWFVEKLAEGKSVPRLVVLPGTRVQEPCCIVEPTPQSNLGGLECLQIRASTRICSAQP